jgi:acyl-CoA thioester hydrolase
MKADNWRKEPGAYRHTGMLQTRITDVDPERHINNVAIHTLYEEAHARFLADALAAPFLARPDHSFRFACVDTEYLEVAHYPEPISYGTRLIDLDSHGYTVASALFQAGRCIGVQRSRVVAWGRGGSMSLQQSVHAALRVLVDPSAPEPAECPHDEAVDLGTFPFDVELSVRYGDFDADGYLSQTAVSRCMEEARTSIVRALWGRHGADLARSPDGMVVARVTVHNLRRSMERSSIRITSGVTRIGNASFVIRAAVADRNGCIAVSDTVAVRFERTTSRARPLDARLREALESCLIEPALRCAQL